jgi:hypothetical protein
MWIQSAIELPGTWFLDNEPAGWIGVRLTRRPSVPKVLKVDRHSTAIALVGKWVHTAIDAGAAAEWDRG